MYVLRLAASKNEWMCDRKRTAKPTMEPRLQTPVYTRQLKRVTLDGFKEYFTGAADLIRAHAVRRNNVFVTALFEEFPGTPLIQMSEVFRRGVDAIGRSLCIELGSFEMQMVNYIKAVDSFKHFPQHLTPEEHDFRRHVQTYYKPSTGPPYHSVSDRPFRSELANDFWREVGTLFNQLNNENNLNDDDDEYTILSQLEDVPVLANTDEYNNNVEPLFTPVVPGTQCCICLMPIEEQQKGSFKLTDLCVKTKCCGNIYHDRCLRHAVCTVGPAHCPLCRFRIKRNTDRRPEAVSAPQTPPQTPRRAPQTPPISELESITINVSLTPRPVGLPEGREILYGDIFVPYRNA
jgi:hypothetical protein